jgi:hypothetical protein
MCFGGHDSAVTKDVVDQHNGGHVTSIPHRPASPNPTSFGKAEKNQRKAKERASRGHRPSPGALSLFSFLLAAFRLGILRRGSLIFTWKFLS